MPNDAAKLHARARSEYLAGRPQLADQLSAIETESFNYGMSAGAVVGVIGGFLLGGVVGYVIGKK